MRIAFVGDSLTEGKPGVSFFANLKERYPNHNLFNYGKGADTVVSLFKRLEKKDFPVHFDLMFLWIGVNDIYTLVFSNNPLMMKMKNPYARDVEEFREYYKKVLSLVLSKTERLITVSPMLIGEQLNNQWNKLLKPLAHEIRLCSLDSPKIYFLDLTEPIIKNLTGKPCSDYFTTKITRVITDMLFYKSADKIDSVSKTRGLQLTLDGVHLNSLGAQIITEEFSRLILKYQNSTVDF